MLGKELITTLKPQINEGTVLIDEDFNTYFTRIEDKFPFMGSKINWEQLKSSVEVKADDINSILEVKNKLKDIMGRFCSDTAIMITVVGDNAMDFALKMSMDSFYENMELIMELPQHVYIAPENFDWCACISMEGYISCGLAEK